MTDAEAAIDLDLLHALAVRIAGHWPTGSGQAATSVRLRALLAAHHAIRATLTEAARSMAKVDLAAVPAIKAMREAWAPKEPSIVSLAETWNVGDEAVPARMGGSGD